MSYRDGQRGFTLVEMAIVIVIIGLLLGGILGGRSLIRSTQAKDVVVIAEDLRAASAYFKQRYSYLPGDLPNPAAVIAANPALVQGTGGTPGNGAIDGEVDAQGQAALGSEVAVAPLQLYAAGFIGKVDAGDPRRMIRSSFGAVHIVSVATATGLVPSFPEPGTIPSRNAIIFVNLPCDIVEEVDGKLDDGFLATGRGMANAASAASCGTATPGNVTFYALAL